MFILTMFCSVPPASTQTAFRFLMTCSYCPTISPWQTILPSASPASWPAKNSVLPPSHKIPWLKPRGGASSGGVIIFFICFYSIGIEDRERCLRQMRRSTKSFSSRTSLSLSLVSILAPCPFWFCLVSKRFEKDAVIFTHHQDRLGLCLLFDGADQVHVPLVVDHSFGHAVGQCRPCR